MSIRPVKRLIKAKPTLEGAGVHLRRAFGFGNTTDFDPFLLLDDFRNDIPAEYMAGFPWHPHRGIETITYVLAGTVEHGDSMGNHGTIGAGDLQWMTAGRGIIHSEMPEQQAGRMRGFQLWINLPARDKMTAPRYQEFSPERIPAFEVTDARGGSARVKVIAGRISDTIGPIVQPATEPLYLDVALDAGAGFEVDLPATHTAFVYVFDGTMRVGTGPAAANIAAPELAVLGPGERIVLEGRAADSRAILVAGRPLGEPVARHGPFVMNTRAEIMQAFEDLRAGRF